MEVSINKNNEIDNINFSNRESQNRSLKNWKSPITKKLFLKLKGVLFNSKGEVIARFKAEPHVIEEINKGSIKIGKEIFFPIEETESIQELLDLKNFKELGTIYPEELSILELIQKAPERVIL